MRRGCMRKFLTLEKSQLVKNFLLSLCLFISQPMRCHYLASQIETSINRKVPVTYFIFFLVIFGVTNYAKSEVIKISHIYSSDELSAILKDPLFISVESEMAQALSSKPANEKQLFSNTEIAFKWGSDWKEIPEFIQARDKMSQDLEKANIIFYNKSFISKRKSQKKIKILNDSELLKFSAQTDFLWTSYSDRMKQLSKELPGFFDWLTEGFKIPWILTSEPLNTSLCKNKNPYKIKQKIVACQNLEMVKIQKDWFENSSPQEIADVFIHELIRYRVTWLASHFPLSQEGQDLLTARVTFNILSNEVSPSELFKLFTSVSLIPKNETIEKIRLHEIDFLLNAQINYIKGLMQINATCSRYYPKTQEEYVKKITDEVLDLITSCRRYLTSNIPSELCSTTLLSFHIHDNRVHCTSN